MENMSNTVSVGYSDNSGRGLALLIACLILSILFVILRFAGRKVERVSWWWDDWAVLLSLLIFVAGFWAGLKIVQYQSQDPGPFLRLIFIHNVLYPLIVSTTKISGLLLHILHFGLERSWARNSYILLALVTVWGLAAFLATLFQCQPFNASWNPITFVESRCIDQVKLLQTTSAIDAVLTLFILISTFPGAYSIDWIFGRGTLIMLNYALGIFGLVCAVLRAISVPSGTAFSPLLQSQSTPNANLDFVAVWTPVLLWTRLEEALGIVTASLYPSAFALLAIFTCNFQEPKSRVFAHFRQWTRAKIAGEGFGALLGDSEERKAWAGGVSGEGEIVQPQKLAGAEATESEARMKLAQLKAQLDEEMGVSEQRPADPE